MNYVQRGFFWIIVYLCLVLTPLFVLLLAPGPSGSGFWWDFSIALGFAGTTMLGVMFVLTARFRRAAAPFGIDLIYYFHRWIALVAFFFIIAHPAILIFLEPSLLDDLRPSVISGYMLAGAISIAALTALMATSLWRQQLRIHYDDWQGESGFITDDLLTRYLPDTPERYQYYLCGPTVMTAIVEKTLQRQGVPLYRIHSELFNLV